MITVEILGVDIAKNVFQLHGVNRNGRVILKRRVMRDQLLAVLAQIDPCTVVVEACTGAFFWAWKFETLGHQVKIISPQYVKPFVRRQKNDGNDAEAILHGSLSATYSLRSEEDRDAARHPGAASSETEDGQSPNRRRQSNPRSPTRSRFRHR